MEQYYNEHCPCGRAACPRRGRGVECIEHHRGTPPEDVVACQREKARQRYAAGNATEYGDTDHQR